MARYFTKNDVYIESAKLFSQRAVLFIVIPAL